VAVHESRLLKRWQSQTLQTTIQKPPVNVNTLTQELVKGCPKIDQVTMLMECLKQAYAAAHLENFLRGPFAVLVVIEKHSSGAEFFRKKDCAKFSKTKCRLSLRRQQVGWILERLHLDPFCCGDLGGPWQAGAVHRDFVVNFSRNENSWIKFVEKVKAAQLRQNDERRGIRNDGHTFERSADRRSASRSSKL